MVTYTQVPFEPDIAGAIVVPAFPSNLIGFSDGSFPANYPKVNVFHTPEEAADDIEVTPYYFARDLRPRRASTHNYADNDGDLYQMVPERYGAIANGVTADMSYPADTDPTISLNLQSRNIEIEGYTATIHLTMPRGGRQWKTVVRWGVAGHYLYNIPLDRAHNIGHYEVASNRTDPGTRILDAIVEDMQALVGEEDEGMKPFNAWDVDRGRTYLIGPFGAIWIKNAADAKELEKKYGKVEMALHQDTIKLFQRN